MSENCPGLEIVVASMRQCVESYARLIQELFGDSGKALTVFGSVLLDGFNVDRDTVRSVLVVERIELPFLRRLADQGARLGISKLLVTASAAGQAAAASAHSTRRFLIIPPSACSRL